MVYLCIAQPYCRTHQKSGMWQVFPFMQTALKLLGRGMSHSFILSSFLVKLSAIVAQIRSVSLCCGKFYQVNKLVFM